MRLMLILAAVISGFVVAGLVFFQATRRTYPGFSQWTAGVGFVTAGYLLMSLRGLIPESLSILMGNIAFPLGMVLHLDGIRRFLGLSPMSRLWYALPAIDLVAIAALYYLHDSPAWRGAVNGIAISAPHFAMAAILFRHPVKHKSMFYPVIGSLIGFAGVVVLTRPIATFFLPEWHLLVDSPFLLGTLALLVVLQLGENLSLIMLNSERMESELLEAEAGLRMTVSRLQGALEEQKRVEESLRESEERYRTFFDTSRDCVFMTSADGRITDFNDVALELLGYSPDDRQEMMRKNVASFYADPEEREVHTKQVTTTGFSKEYPVDLRKKDGTSIHTLITTVARKDRQGNVIGFQGTIRDVTDRKRAEEALRSSKEKYKHLVEKAREAIFVVQDNVFRFVNPSVEEILGLPADQLLGNSFVAFLHPDDREMVVDRHYRRLKGESIPSRYTIRIIDGQERERWVEIDSMQIDWEGSPAIMVFLTDITFRKLAEEAAVQTERLQAIADLSAGVAHHFNNLLQMIMGSTSLSLYELASGDLTKIKTTLERMLEATKLGAETVRRLQTFANIRADIKKEEAAVFDVAATARNAAEFSKPLWKGELEKEGIQVNLQLHLEEGCLVQGKENEIFEVLVNLIRNAAEAMPEGGDLDVQAKRETDEVVIDVCDTGIGIAEDDLPKVFQPFWSSKGVGIGKGMGLAVTHGLVKRHGGTISVHSIVGAGTTFTIRLPLAREPVTKAEPQSVRIADDHLSVLIVEDEPHIAMLLERILAKAGHKVFKTLSGGEGVSVFRKEPVDLIFCDLGMPGMSGWDVGKVIRSICQERGIAKPHFVLLTGWGGQDLEAEEIAGSGTDTVVSKPIDSAALLAIVQGVASRMKT